MGYRRTARLPMMKINYHRRFNFATTVAAVAKTLVDDIYDLLLYSGKHYAAGETKVKTTMMHSACSGSARIKLR